MFKCDDYFEANNVTITRGIKGLSSGVIMDNIRNIDKWPSSPAVSGRQNKMAVLRMRGSVTCGSKTKWPSCACGVASLVAAKQNGRLAHAGSVTCGGLTKWPSCACGV